MATAISTATRTNPSEPRPELSNQEKQMQALAEKVVRALVKNGWMTGFLGDRSEQFITNQTERYFQYMKDPTKTMHKNHVEGALNPLLEKREITMMDASEFAFHLGYKLVVATPPSNYLTGYLVAEPLTADDSKER